MVTTDFKVFSRKYAISKDVSMIIVLTLKLGEMFSDHSPCRSSS